MVAIKKNITFWIGGNNRPPTTNIKDTEMEITHRRTLILALAGLLAFNSSFADEVVLKVATKPAVVDTDTVNRELAREANTAAAKQAVAAVIEETRLDLDIRLIGPTSVKIAGDQ
jgi:hypothetical protein